MKVVLFCGGLGTRLREMGDDLPKPMVRIGYRPILWHVMKYYAHFGHTQFILCLGYKADVIKEYFLNYKEWITNDFTMRRGGRDVALETSDIDDWEIRFVDTGLRSNVGQRLRAVRQLLEGEEMFLANYSDGLTDLNLHAQVDDLAKSDKIASFLCSRPTQSFHVVDCDKDGSVTEISPVGRSGILINAGYFVFRREIFDYIREGEELVVEPFRRLIGERRLKGYRYDPFWCMDTFKEQQELSDMFVGGNAPWMVWAND